MPVPFLKPTPDHPLHRGTATSPDVSICDSSPSRAPSFNHPFDSFESIDAEEENETENE